jgi:hypothetical protein
MCDRAYLPQIVVKMRSSDHNFVKRGVGATGWGEPLHGAPVAQNGGLRHNPRPKRIQGAFGGVFCMIKHWVFRVVLRRPNGR